MSEDIDGPAVPSAAAVSTLRPLAHNQVVLDPREWLGEWQQRTAAASMPHIFDRIEGGKARSNLARLLGESDAPLSHHTFTDSDVYKTLEAVAWLSPSLAPDDPLIARAHDLVELLVRVQEDDGYLNSYVQGSPDLERYADPQWGHELYSAGHLFQAAVAADRTGSLPELLDVAARFADHLVRRFPTDGPRYVEGHPIVETALVELYRQTRERAYLDLARWLLAQRGHGWLGEDRFGSAYFQDHTPITSGAPATGHAVRQLYLLAGVVDVAVETDDRALLNAAIATWEDLFTSKTYISGAHGSRHRDEAIGDPYELPPDRAYSESCAAVASLQLNWRLLLATGDVRYAEEMETALYNAIAVSTSLDGTGFFYSNPLQLRTGHDGTHEDAPSQRLPWFMCPCCPPNIARLLATAHDYVATSTDGGLQIHHPTAATLTTALPHGVVRTTMTTAYPYDGTIRLAVECDAAEPWELAFRIPSWSPHAVVRVDGAEVAAPASDGYLRIERSWAGGHEVVITLDMHVRVIRPHPRIDAVRGCIAIARGPLLYCVEQASLPDDVVLEDLTLERVLGERVGDTLAPTMIDVELRHDPAQSQPAYYSVGRRPDPAPVATITAPAVPYHRWANRAPGAMRVWIPTSGQRIGGEPTPDQEQ